MFDSKHDAAADLLERIAMIDPSVTAVAQKVSAFLDEHGLVHAIAGGMAVAVHGYRSTCLDHVFVVPDDAAEVIGLLGPNKPVSGAVPGVTVDVDGTEVTFIFPRHGVVQEDLADPLTIDGLPFLRIVPLVVLKLRARRTQDMADIVGLVKLGKVTVGAVTERLSGRDRGTFDTLVQIARLEAKGETRTARRLFHETMITLLRR